MVRNDLLSFAVRAVLVALCVYGLHLLLRETQWRDVSDHMASLSGRSVALAFGAVFVSYIALIGYDYLGCRYANASVKPLTIASTACLANAISNVVGFALFSGGAVRLRCYGAVGVSPSAVAKVSFFCTMTFLLGLMGAAALGLTFDPAFFSPMTGLSKISLRTIGIVLLLACAALPFVARWKRSISLRNHTIDLPSATALWGQYVVGGVDIIATGAVLYFLLPQSAGLSLLSFIPLFSAAVWVGLMSNVPAGLGVFETVILTGLGRTFQGGEILGALFLYRVFYYLVPFIVAVAALVFIEMKALAPELKKPLRILVGVADYFLPALLAGLTAIAGILLLASGATPAVSKRLDVLVDYIPLGVIESSHLMGSIVGFALLIVARGLYNRYDSAYVTTIFLLVAGVILSLFKGFDYEEALVLLFILPMLAVSRRMFYRPSKVSMMDVGWGWWSFVALTLGGVVWLLFFAYKNVQYDHYLWWQIALGQEGDASRSLRSMVVICVFGLGLGVNQLFRTPKLVLPKATKEDLARAERIVAQSSSTNTCLALTGDKFFLFSPQGDAFVMFGKTSRSLIAMGDPVGNPARFSRLIWQMREMADRHRRGLAFYQISTQYMPAYIDSGMQLVRLGEEALIDLQDLTLEGPRYKSVRYNLSKGEREKLTFDIVPIEGVPAIIDTVKSISDEWLRSKMTREKSFSLGRYEESYIRRFPMAVVRRDGEIIAFANLWAIGDKTELSVDLMRHRAEMPNGTMDFLFSKLLLWGKERGYRYFNIGMVPLSGFNTHRLAPLWTKFGSFVYHHGERFYNFQGVHAFKAKYHPLWFSRYLAYTGKSSLLILLDVAVLIAGGFRGLFRK